MERERGEGGLIPEEQVKLTPENIEWGIEEALGHYAEDWIRRNVREMLRVGKRDEAIKFLSEHIRNFGVASPGQPYVCGTPKGVLIQSAIMDPKETKLITWAELLRHVEMEEVKTLEAYGVIPTVIPKIPPKPIVTPPVEEEVEEAEEEEEVPETYKTAGRVAYPVKIEVNVRTGTWPYDVDMYYNDKFIQSSSQSTIPELEEYLKLGESEINLSEARLSVGDLGIILGSLHDWFGVYPELAPVFEKVSGERWDEITDKEKGEIEEAWGDAWSKEWVLTWTPADVVWSPEAQKEKEIYYHKYTYDSLMVMKADEIREIARIKKVRTGRREEMAKAIHQFDYGEEEAKSKMAEIDKLLG